jgi:hypothetical protein
MTVVDSFHCNSRTCFNCIQMFSLMGDGTLSKSGALQNKHAEGKRKYNNQSRKNIQLVQVNHRLRQSCHRSDWRLIFGNVRGRFPWTRSIQCRRLNAAITDCTKELWRAVFVRHFHVRASSQEGLMLKDGAEERKSSASASTGERKSSASASTGERKKQRGKGGTLRTFEVPEAQCPK